MDQYCYFCEERCMNFCLIKSLYNKHNGIADKYVDLVDGLLDQKQKTKYQKYRSSQYKELCIQIDTEQNISQYHTDAISQMVQLHQYYKYRVYVPVFAHGPCTNSVYNYYYDRLKYYYNGIKKKLNMTVQPSMTQTQKQDSSQIFNKKKFTSKQFLIDKQLLKQLKDPTSIEEFQTQSKALKETLAIISGNKKLDRIKTLKTEDYLAYSKEFADFKHKKEEIYVQSYLASFQKRKNNVLLVPEKSISKSKNNSNTNIQNKTKRINEEELNSMKKQTTLKSIKIKGISNSTRSLRFKQNKNLLEKYMSEHKGIDTQAFIKPIFQKFNSMPKINSMRSSTITKIIEQKKPNKQASPYKKNLSKSREKRIAINANTIMQPLQKSSQKKDIKKQYGSDNKKFHSRRQSINMQSTDNIITIRQKKLQEIKSRTNKKKLKDILK